MDEDMIHVDRGIEDEVQKGYRDAVLPPHIVQALKNAHHITPAVPVIERVRYLHLNPAKRAKIGKQVLKRYHPDLKDNDLLSSAELRRINIQRGEWSEENDRRIVELVEKTNTLMLGLSSDGFDYQARWNQDMFEHFVKVKSALEKNEFDNGDLIFKTDEEHRKGIEILDRWFGWNRERQDEYTMLFAAEQGKDQYSVDRDQQWLLDRAPTLEFVDSIQAIDDLRDKIRRFAECQVLRTELLELQVKQAKMLADSIEQRRDVCEEMARLYYCVEVIDENGVGKGPLVKDFDSLWEFPDDVIRFLQTKLYMFFRGQPDSPEAENFLQTWGFLPAPPETSSKQSSGASPVEPSSSTASQAATGTPAPSSGSQTVTS